MSTFFYLLAVMTTKLNNFTNSMSAIGMIKPVSSPDSIICQINSNQADNCAIEPFIIGTHITFSGCEYITGAIRSIKVGGMTCQLIPHHHIPHHHGQTEEHCNSTITPFKKNDITPSIRMQLTTLLILH